jgi:DtxR family Mn-dependent transcriptional regulator
MNFSPIWTLIGVVGLIALLALILWPGSGLVARWRLWRSAVQRQRVEDALKYMFDLQQEGYPASIDALRGVLKLSERAALLFISQIQAQGLVTQNRRDLALTPAGQRWALQIVRAHRLWERYLADDARMPLERIHREAHQREHGMTEEQVDALDASLGYPQRDPHGDPIPNAQGMQRDKTPEGVPLTAWNPGQRAKIIHLEDEPPVAYAQLLALGIQVGDVVTVIESTPEKIALLDGENELVIAPAIAGNIYLEPLTEPAPELVGVIPLSELPGFTKAEVVKLDERCQGFTRRRFLDLGLTPGTPIRLELNNAFKEPRAYRLRGTLIALRNDQANQIWVRPTLENR